MDRQAVPEGPGLRLRFLLPLVAIALLAAIPAGANATVLYDSGQAGPEPDGTQVEVSQNTRVAQQFTPATTGTARYVWFSAFAYCCAGSQIPEGPAPFTLRIQENNSTTNLPGRLLTAVAGIVSDDGGVGVGGCLKLEEEATLSASQSYWVVLETGSKRFFWNPGASGGGQVRRSTNGGPWQTPNSSPEQGPNPNSLSLWVSDASCDPHAVANPVAGQELGDMYAKAGGSGFNSITIGNDGNNTLTLTGRSITGANPGNFQLLDNNPNGAPPGKPFVFPKSQGPGPGVIFLYPACFAGANEAEGERRATLTVTTNDPTQPTISWPLWCLIDNTPPSIQYTQNPTGRAGWHVIDPAPLTAQGIDPESGNRVKRIFCEDTDYPDLDFDSGSVASFEIAGSGIHEINCRATDVANNTSDAGLHPVTVKVDAIAPNATALSGPEGILTSNAASFEFVTADSPSGVQEIECKLDSGPWTACTSPVSRSSIPDGSHTFRVRTRDKAGNYDLTPASWTWRVDTTPPDTTLAGGPKPFTKALTASFIPGGTDAVAGLARLQCSLDGAAFATCLEPLAYAGLAEGPHVLRARAVDNVGFIDPTPAVRNWTIDLTTPVVSKLKAPNAFLTYKSSEVVSATIVLERFDKAKRRFVREKKYRRNAVEGRNKLRLPKRLEAGRYRVTITAVDRAGHKSKLKRLRFRR